MPKMFIAGNWKMHKTVQESRLLAEEIIHRTEGTAQKVMIAPPFTALHAVAESVRNSHVLLGAQNVSFAEQGAHTGEISIQMLKDLRVDVVIIGHSERRAVYGETDEMINKKVLLSIKNGLEVILCVGETLEEREKGAAKEVTLKQLRAGLDGVAKEMMPKVTIAYEPVWAIGTGKTATPQDANEMHKEIRLDLEKLYSAEIADNCVIQYGGSVKPDNCAALMAMEHINGALVGGASLQADTFVPIVEFYT